MDVLLTKEYITGLLEKRGLSKAEFAKRMGYSKRQYLEAMLSSKKKDINTVIKMAEVLGMPLNDFIYGSTSVVISGFVKINDNIREVHSLADLQSIVDEIKFIDNTVE